MAADLSSFIVSEYSAGAVIAVHFIIHVYSVNQLFWIFTLQISRSARALLENIKFDIIIYIKFKPTKHIDATLGQIKSIQQ